MPVLVTAAALHAEGHLGSGLVSRLPLALILAVAVHAAGNLVNTLHDFRKGGDRKEGADDRTLVDGILQPDQIASAANALFVVGLFVACALAYLVQSALFVVICASGMLLAYAYTADPVSLKYRALGDVAIVLCFGPLVVCATSLVLSGAVPAVVLEACLPVVLLTEAILHANNTRDIKADARAGAVTLAGIMGDTVAKLSFVALLAAAYAGSAFLAGRHGPLWALPILTTPLALGLARDGLAGRFTEMPQRVAQLNLLFSVLLLLGCELQAMLV